MTAAALEAMLALVAEQERTAVAAIAARAEAEADALVRAARSENRARLKTAVAEMRATLRQEVAQADAAVETARRRHRARCEFALLADVAGALRGALQARWEDPAARRQWVAALLRAAITRLPAGALELVHAPGWPAAEREAAAVELARAGLPPARMQEDAGVGAGLRIERAGTCLDATLAGLLADPAAINGRLLAALGEGGA